MGDLSERAMVIVLVGVSGVGKTTVGLRLAETLEWEFFDGDAFHPAANIDKMAQGIPLTDEDRWPWLRAIHDFIHERLMVGASAVVACSALKAAYRDALLDGNDGAHLVFLKGDFDLIERRLEARAGHFFNAELLESQFEALEEPDPGEVFTVAVDRPPDEIVCRIKSALVEDSSDAASEF